LKAIKLVVNKNEDAPLELYNLANDPAESMNGAAQNPGIVKKMANFIKQAHSYNSDWPLLKSEIR
jgi:hypothetical protein